MRCPELAPQPSPSRRGDALTICGEDFKLIQFQDPHPAAKDPLESRRQFHTWIPRHNGWALKCMLGSAPTMHWCPFCIFLFFFSEHVDTGPLKYITVSISTICLEASGHSCVEKRICLQKLKKRTFQKELERGDKHFTNDQ